MIRLRSTCTSRPSMAGTIRSGPWARPTTMRGAPASAMSSWTSARVSSSPADIERALSARDSSASTREASEMSLIRRSSRCTSSRMMVISFLCCVRILDARHGFDRAAQRRQRILDLMGDVGGEALDRVHALPQRLGHVAQRRPERSPISSPRREKSGIVDLAALAAAHRSAASARRWIGRAMVPAR